jgi:ribosomal protein L32
MRSSALPIYLLGRNECRQRRRIRLTLAVNFSTLPHFTKAASCGETPDAGSVTPAKCRKQRQHVTTACRKSPTCGNFDWCALPHVG